MEIVELMNILYFIVHTLICNSNHTESLILNIGNWEIDLTYCKIKIHTQLYFQAIFYSNKLEEDT